MTDKTTAASEPCQAVGAPVEQPVRQRADGGPAFPLSSPAAEWKTQRIDDAGSVIHAHWEAAAGIGGMSLRDYFASRALVGLLAQSMGSALCSDPRMAAEYAYSVADAMLAVRAA